MDILKELNEMQSVVGELPTIPKKLPLVLRHAAAEIERLTKLIDTPHPAALFDDIERRCPFCEHVALEVQKVENGRTSAEAVLCHNCHARGPLAAGEPAAWVRWNVRGEHCVYGPAGDGCVCGNVDPEALERDQRAAASVFSDDLPY